MGWAGLGGVEGDLRAQGDVGLCGTSEGWAKPTGSLALHLMGRLGLCPNACLSEALTRD
jgi:hypothetical protein